MNVFVDTSVLLKAYDLSRADLEELRRALALVEDGQVNLIVTEQVVDEYWRQRESTIAEMKAKFEKTKIELPIPNLFSGYPQRELIDELRQQIDDAKRELLDSVNQDLENENHEADIVILRLFELVTPVSCGENIVQKARLRELKGNPPGKRRSLGDSISWECLLAVVPQHEDINIVVDDGDFYSALNQNKPSEFLTREWRSKKKADLILYRSMDGFLRQHFPEIQLVDDYNKHLAIRALVESPNFESTHRAVARLNNYATFTESEREEIARAVVRNSQIRWIVGDGDVREFISGILEQFESDEQAELVDELHDLLGDKVNDWWEMPEEDLPF